MDDTVNNHDNADVEETTTQEPEAHAISAIDEADVEMADRFLRVLENDDDMAHRFGLVMITNETVMRILVSNMFQIAQDLGNITEEKTNKGRYQVKVHREQPDTEHYALITIQPTNDESLGFHLSERTDVDGEWTDVTEDIADSALEKAIANRIEELDPQPEPTDVLYLTLMEVSETMVMDGKTPHGEEVKAGSPEEDEETNIH